MRTKALLGLAVLAAGAFTASAQIYSQNIVGYYNVTMKPGYNLVANQLNVTGGNKLDNVLPAAPGDTAVLKYVNGAYVQDISDGANWLDANTGDPSTTTVNPGEGFFYNNPDTANRVVTFVGEVTTGNNLTVTCKPGYTLVSSIIPQAIDLTDANGFPQVGDAAYLTYVNPPGNYVQLINDGSTWLDANTGDPLMATPQIGQGFFINNPNSTDLLWVRSFNP